MLVPLLLPTVSLICFLGGSVWDARNKNNLIWALILWSLKSSLSCRYVKVKWSESHSVMSDSATPTDCSPQGSSVKGILQARIPEWVAIPFSMGPSWLRNQIQVSCVAGRFFTIWATREASRYLSIWICPHVLHVWLLFCVSSYVNIHEKESFVIYSC